MTDKTDKTPEIDPSQPEKATVQDTPATVGAEHTGKKSTYFSQNDTAKQPAAKSKHGLTVLAAAIVLALVGGGVWYGQQQQKDYVDLERQLQANIQASNKAVDQVQQVQSQLRDLQQKYQQLQRELADSQERTQDLHQAFQTLTDAGGQQALLNDVEHLVNLAQQQLLIGGNVNNAIVSMETAQARLARANRPTLASLQQTINGDLQRLRAITVVDVSSLSRQLDTLQAELNRAVLLAPDAAVEENEDTASEPTIPEPVFTEETPWWERTAKQSWYWVERGWDAVSQDLGDLVSVRRIDDASALLLSPEQADRLRDNLRLRITTARLALMTGQPLVWQSEMNAVLAVLQQRFDVQTGAGAEALQLTRSLLEMPIVTHLPTLDNSLQALESMMQKEAVDDETAAANEADEPAEAGTVVEEQEEAGDAVETVEDQPDATTENATQAALRTLATPFQG
ncbi:uroporphyrinogen-III C-methyltransferase [Paenalcaligenes sp. Me131]|uniref:uroporphyrinogen-III C-methyltransferase n=1 Tax=Paenalcaligenes sp. Me131 TaxID=3392636 RepID=UPI003D2E53E9